MLAETMRQACIDTALDAGMAINEYDEDAAEVLVLSDRQSRVRIQSNKFVWTPV